jgi:hypothetical protein
LFEPVVQAFIELSGADECGLGAESADGAGSFEGFEAVVFSVPVVDLCQQAIFTCARVRAVSMSSRVLISSMRGWSPSR